MKRKSKNIIMIIVLVGLIVASVFTIKLASSTKSESSMMKGTPPGMSERAGGRNMKEPPFRSDGDSSSSNGNMKERPSRPDRDSNSNSGNMEEPPSRPDRDSSESDGMPSMDREKQNGGPSMGGAPSMNSNNISTLYYVLFGIESLAIGSLIMYLILSNFNKKNIKETFKERDKIVIYVLSTIIITGGLTFLDTNAAKNIQPNTSLGKQDNIHTNSSEITSKASGNQIVDGNEQTLSDSYETSTEDESVVLVKNGGNATIDGATITKSGDSSNTENSEFYGINAGILVTENSTSTIKNAKISTNAKGSNAVFATGTNAKIYINDSEITTTGSSSARGLDATYGGYIEADNVSITTQGGSSATLATDRGEGTVIAKNSKLETNGSGSPVIYSTGNISIENTTGTANGSQMVVIEGKNSAVVTNSTLTASGKGNRGEVDHAGIMIYQSMSGDASEGTGTFTAKNSSLSIDENSNYYKTAPMFFITNTDAVINLENTTLNYGSNLLISSKGTSEWGNSGSNGGNVILNATNQILNGNIEIDNISTVTMNLNNSSYAGTINIDQTAKSITLKLDRSSKITLTGDSYVTSLEDEDESYSNINFNGYKLYVNGKAIN